MTDAPRNDKPPSIDHASSSLQSIVEDAGLALGLIALAALTSTVSQLTLSPVFGSIPASINHQTAITVTYILGFVLYSVFGRGSSTRLLVWLPLVAALIPAAQLLALTQSEQLGVAGGAILAGLISCHALIVPSAYAAASVMARLPINLQFASVSPSLIHASIALLPFLVFERFFATQLPEIIALSQIFTPADIQLVVSAAFVLLCGSGPLITVSTWSLLIVSYLFNPHGSGPYATVILDRSLAQHNWTLLARQWSLTGYISVLEDRTNDYRVLRCDHSLLGGEWLLDGVNKVARLADGWKDNEPIYSVFTMLEAVRLLKTDAVIEDARATALVIGLGIGTAPKALIQHGIHTKIIELDQAVHDYATQYFSLPLNHTVQLTDAISWVREEARTCNYDFGNPQYDYIIHDVFTGGAEPLPLFTTSFLKDLRMLLTDSGVAAINYAGDLSSPLTKLVLNTIDLTFDRQCEVYSDDATPKMQTTEHFSNFIVFCRNSPGPITFREPTTADFLGSLNRKSYLMPKLEQREERTWASDQVLQEKDVRLWRRAQEASAVRHWSIMRTVLPPRIWELY